VAFRRSKDAEPARPAGPAPDPASLSAWVNEQMVQPGWGPLEVRSGDRVVEPPRAPSLPPLTSRTGLVATRYRALQLHAAGESLTGDEARAVLARLGHTFRRGDTDELRRLRAAGTVLDALAASTATVDAAVAVVRWADEGYGCAGLPLAPLAGVEVAPLSAGYLAALGPAVERALELRDALTRGAPLPL